MTFYSEYRYSIAGSVDGENDELFNKYLIRKIHTLPNIKTICELGCGNGYLASQLADIGYEVVGVDASQSGIEVAERNYGQKVEFVNAIIDKSLADKLGERKFDLILSKEVIEHLYRPADLLECAQEIIAPQGCFLLTTPYHGYFKNLAIALLGHSDIHYNPLFDGGHIKFFSVKTLSTLLTNCGFHKPKFSFYGRFPGFQKSMVCVVRGDSST